MNKGFFQWLCSKVRVGDCDCCGVKDAPVILFDDIDRTNCYICLVCIVKAIGKTVYGLEK